MVFAVTQMGGMHLAVPDVCITPLPIPAPPGFIPTPIPYPNVAVPAMAVPSQVKLFSGAMPNHNLMTIIPMSSGDNPGTLLNPISGLIMGPSKIIAGSIKVFISGMPASRMLSITGQNGILPGAIGAVILPSQVTVMIPM